MATRGRRRGRPPLPEGERQSVRLKVNVTPDEAQEIEAAAEDAGQPVSAFLRALILRVLRRRRR